MVTVRTMSNQYPVVAEVWSTFEAALLVNAKRLAEDIAKHQGKDPKALWALIKPQIRINLVDTEFPEPTFCSYPIGTEGGAVYQRCRVPCVLGFSACSRHVNLTVPQREQDTKDLVDCVKDCHGTMYYVDANKIARDKNGIAKGVVEEDVLFLFSPS